MSSKNCGVVGPSQQGKSSFINFISGQVLAPVGQNDGQSCTKHASILSFPDLLRIFGTNVQLNCIDLPGFNDTSVLLSNKKIVEEVKLGVAGLGGRQLDALFLFQSSSESSFQLQKSFQLIETLFGPKILRSLVVIATKSDIVLEQVLPKRQETIESIAREKNVQVVWWVNDSEENGKVSEAKKYSQAAQLHAAINQLQPYEMTNMQEFASRVQVQAEQMVKADSSNIVQQNVTVPYDVVVDYEEDEAYTVPALQRKYPEPTVLQEARRLQALPANKEPYNVTRTITETVQVPEEYDEWRDERVWHRTFFIRWRETISVCERKVRYVPRQQTRTVTETAYRDRPLEHFAAPLRQEMVPTTEQRVRRVTRQRSEKRTRTEVVTSYRKDWTHYRLQAAKELIVS